MSETPLRIGFDASCLIPQPLTGVGYYTLHLLEALLRQPAGCELSLFASSAQACPQVLTDLGKRVRQLTVARWPTRMKTWMWTRLNMPALERFTGPVDIAHGGFHLLPPTQQAKRVVTVFDLSNLRHPDTHTAESVHTHLKLLRHAIPRADGIIAISESCRQDVIELLDAPPEKVHVVYGGVFLEEFSSPMEEPLLFATKKRFGIDRPYFIHLGTLEPRKNLPRLLEAYARTRQTHPDGPLLVLAGRPGWKFEPVQETIRRLGLGKDVIQTGYLTREEAIVLLRGAYACVYPSLYEGFGLPVLEAMAARTPVLTSNVSSLPEVIGDTGIQVDPESIDAIQAGLAQLLDHYDSACARTQAAHARACQFTWQASASQLVNAYHRIHEGNTGDGK